MNNKNTSVDMKLLITQAKGRDQKAQSALIELTQQRLNKFCILLGNNKELAEDLCQEAYIKAFTNLDKLSSPDSFYAWLCQIAKNLFFDHKRKDKERLLREGEEVTVESDLFGRGEFMSPQYETIIQVQRVLKTFDPEDRFLILMIELEGLTYIETAELLKTSEDAVRSKLHRLRIEFTKLLKK